MSPLLKILIGNRPVRRAFIAKRELLERVRHAAVVAQHAEACVPLGLLRPRDQPVPIAALPDLAVPNLVEFVYGRHRRIIGEAHEVLPQRVDAVVEVLRFNDGGFATLVIDVRFAYVFLIPKVVSRSVKGEERDGGAYEAMHMMESFDVVNAFCVIPWEACG